MLLFCLFINKVKSYSYEIIEENLDEQSIAFTDKSTSYVDTSEFVELHVTEKSSNDNRRNFIGSSY